MGASGGKSNSASGQEVPATVAGLEKETSPLRGTVISQMLEALRTGGIGALNPLISRSVEASRQATSDTMSGLGSSLATKNLGGTPLGGAVVARAALAGNQATNAIAPNLAFQIGQSATPFVGGITSSELGALAGVSNSSSFNQQAGANISGGK